MPNRVIKESIKRSPQIDALTWFEEVVFYRLLVTVDDYGCADARPILLRNELFPTKENITKKSIEDAIRKLVSVGLLCEYEVSGMPYLLFPTWEKHQRIRNKHRKFPAPPDDIHLTANCCQMTADCLSESESNPNPNPNPRESAPAKHKYGEYSNVLLTDDELAKLKTEFGDWQQRIERLSAYKASTGKAYKNDLATIRNWARRDGEKKAEEAAKKPKPSYDMDEISKRFALGNIK